MLFIENQDNYSLLVDNDCRNDARLREQDLPDAFKRYMLLMESFLQVPVKIYDLSRTGIGLLIPNDNLNLSCRDDVFFISVGCTLLLKGTVRHKIHSDSGWCKLGIEFTQNEEWQEFCNFYDTCFEHNPVGEPVYFHQTAS